MRNCAPQHMHTCYMYELKGNGCHAGCRAVRNLLPRLCSCARRGGAALGSCVTRGACASTSGATKIIPVEAGPPETGATNPEATSADLAPRRGYQEYAIQQTPYEQPMKSSRYRAGSV